MKDFVKLMVLIFFCVIKNFGCDLPRKLENVEVAIFIEVIIIESIQLDRLVVIDSLSLVVIENLF